MVALARSGWFFALVSSLIGISQAFAEQSAAAAMNDLAENLRSTVEKVMATPKPADRLKALAQTAKDLGLEQIPGALEIAKAFPQLREQAVFREAILKRWSELAPRDAFVHIAALPESSIKLEAIRFAANKFASENCEEAGRMVTTFTGGRSRNDAIDVVAGVWARKNVQAAL